MTQYSHSKITVSIIIPIYGVELFIERCAMSLMEQTLQDVEFIFVDDCTPDKSMDVLQNVLNKYPERGHQIHILRHKKNKGLPAARNTGLSVAQGEYVFHCDSDDFLEPTILEKMYHTAKEEDADFVWCDWFLSYENKERVMRMPQYETVQDALQSMLAGGMKYNVWNKLMKRSLYTENNISFSTGHSMGEDMTMIRLCACAKKVAHVAEPLYHYVRTNGEAMTQSVSEAKIADMRYNIDETIDFLKGREIVELDKWIALFQLQSKFPFLITDDDSLLTHWKMLYPEANRFIGQNPYESSRAKMLQYLAKNGQFWLVKLYYLFVYKVIYRLLYH